MKLNTVIYNDEKYYSRKDLLYWLAKAELAFRKRKAQGMAAAIEQVIKELEDAEA